MAEAVAAGSENRGSREARRRRIADRGAERLAFITGHIKSLPSNSSSDPPAGDFSPREDLIDRVICSHESAKNHVVHETLSRGSNAAIGAPELACPEKELPEIQLSTDSSEQLFHFEESGRKTSPKTEKICSSTAASENRASNSQVSENEPLGISLSTQSSLQQHHASHQPTSDIYSAITASENTRLWCSLSVATLIILSQMQMPVPACFSQGSIFGLPPVYALLATNISIFMAKFVLSAKGLKLPRAGPGTTSTVDLLGKHLGILMLIWNVVGALLMDLFVYAVVLICGLSLLHPIG